MTVRRVRFTGIARGQLRETKKWWRENRTPPEVFAEDVEEALFVVARLPGAGLPYVRSPVPKSGESTFGWVSSHLYYTFTDSAVVIRVFWHTSRRSGPRLVP